MLKKLKEIGLNEKEALVYIELLKLGTQPASVIARRISIPKSTGNFNLEVLVKKGFATKTKKGTTFLYTAENPEVIINMLEYRKKRHMTEIDNKIQTVRSVITELESVQKGSLVKPKITFYEGKEGIIKVLNDTLTSKTDLLVYSDVAGLAKYIYDYNNTEYAPKRKALGLFEKVIIPNTKEALTHMKNYKSNNVTEIVFIDHKLFPFYSEIIIYDNKVSYVTFSENGHVGLIIENKEIYETQKSAFEMAWAYGKDKYKGLMKEYLKMKK